MIERQINELSSLLLLFVCLFDFLKEKLQHVPIMNMNELLLPVTLTTSVKYATAWSAIT